MQRTPVRPSTKFYSRFSLDMDSSPGFGSTASNSTPYSDSLSLRLRRPHLNLATDRNSLAHSPIGTPSPGQGKPRHQALTACKHTVSGSLSLPYQGSFSPFPHGTCPLSVAKVFSLGEWSPQLLTGFACPVILRIPARPSRISPTGLSPSPVRLSSAVPLSVPALPPVLQPRTSLRQLGLDCSAFARHYSRNPLFSSGYLDVSLPRVPRYAAISSPRAAPAFPRAGFPIRRPAAQCLTTTPRSFSQWYTSFLGLWRQGILRMPFVAYPAVLQSNDQQAAAPFLLLQQFFSILFSS